MKISKNQNTDRIGVQIVGEKFDRAGYLFREQPISDYGIDAQIELVHEETVTGKLVALQIKSGPSYFSKESNEAYIYRGDINHLNYWLKHSLPVLIVLCDTNNKKTFWQSITPSNIIYTKKAWKIEIPKYQQINSGMYVDLQYLVNKLPIYKNYTIGSIRDTSHGLAKRYCLRIILNKEHTQSEIVHLIKNATSEAINAEYHRDDLTRTHWSNTPAHVIWLDIFPSSEDEKNNNFICQTEWFSTNLDEKYMPISNNGEEISPNLKVKWNNNYLVTAKYNAENSIGKEEFIIEVSRLIKRTSELVDIACNILKEYKQRRIDMKTLKKTLSQYSSEIDDIYSLSGNIGIPEYECKDVGTVFQSLVSYAHNVFLSFSDIGISMGTEQIVYNIDNQSKYYLDTLEEFNFEISKVKN